jgi:signal transduction histidine kinase
MNDERSHSTRPDSGGKARGVPLWRGLSGKVLALIVLFVMVGEVLIFLPSIANFRVTWLKERIAMAEIAVLVVDAAPDQKVSDELRHELLMGAGVHIVALKRSETRELVLRSDMPGEIDAAFDLRTGNWVDRITEALVTLALGGRRMINVADKPPNMSGELIEIGMDEAPLRAAMLRYSVNILTLSVILSLIVATLAYIALHRMLVRPIRRLIAGMQRFSTDPEDAARIVVPDGRADEIGMAERQLASMQSELHGLLQQKSRLAALGLAVSKVSHDLRNMLASAHLMSDRLAKVDDPTVRRFAPKLISSLDRAIDFCAQTLKYGRVQEAPPRRERFELRGLAEEVVDTAVVQASSRVVIYNDIAPELEVDADREHLFRILMNLVRNAVEAVEEHAARGDSSEDGAIRLRAWREGGVVSIEVADNGPGVPQQVREHLFEAFRGSARSGGTGLGLNIARELARAHGGDIQLVSEAGSGAVFRLAIPDRVSELRPGRRGQKLA